MIILSVEQACEILDLLGCSSDPVYDKTELVRTVSELQYDLDAHGKDATKLKIIFYADNTKIVTGSLQDMVLERMELKHNAKPSKINPFVKHCKTCRCSTLKDNDDDDN